MAGKMPSEKVTTDIGTAHYPHIHAKDSRFSKKQDGSDAFYKCGIVLQGKAAKQVLGVAKRMIKDALDRGLTEAPGKLPGEWDAESETLILKTKSTYKPAVFDSAGVPIPEINLGAGSQIKLAVNFVVYEGFGATGVTPYLNAVQVIEFQEGGGGSADSFGFDATEGFTASEGESYGFDEPAEDEAEVTDAPDGDFDGSDF